MTPPGSATQESGTHGVEPDGAAVARVEDERSQLISIAFRMLGAMAEAEDAVQEAFLRWYRLGEAERREVRNPGAWLTTATSRICLDMLGSARARRESYVGPWLPEPLPAHAPAVGSVDPEARAALNESVSMAMLVVMERMTAAERVAFVLHDVFAYPFDEIASTMGRSPDAARQLASSARRRVRESERSQEASPAHAQVVRAFLTAAAGGDLAELVAVLDPAVVLTSDGGGVVRAALNPIYGSDKAARFILGVLQRRPDVSLVPGRSGNHHAVLLVDEGGVGGVVELRTHGGRAVDVWIQWNPNKLTQWRSSDLTFARHASSVE